MQAEHRGEADAQPGEAPRPAQDGDAAEVLDGDLRGGADVQEEDARVDADLQVARAPARGELGGDYCDAGRVLAAERLSKEVHGGIVWWRCVQS